VKADCIGLTEHYRCDDIAKAPLLWAALAVIQRAVLTAIVAFGQVQALSMPARSFMIAKSGVSGAGRV